ncbi:MAG: hypothetical protein WC955_13080 [Elusimicrobiota bacterium]
MAQVLRLIFLVLSFVLSYTAAISIKRMMAWVVGEYLSGLPILALHLVFNLYTYLPLLIIALLIFLIYDDKNVSKLIWSTLGGICVGVTLFQPLYSFTNIFLPQYIVYSSELYLFFVTQLLPFILTGTGIGIFIAFFDNDNSLQESILLCAGTSLLLLIWISLLKTYRLQPGGTGLYNPVASYILIAVILAGSSIFFNRLTKTFTHPVR